MINITCTLQEGIVPSELRETLAGELVRLASGAFGGAPEDVNVAFDEIPQGFGFRGGELSTTSRVIAMLPQTCQQDVRVEYLKQVCEMWTRITGCTTHEIVASARDPR